MVFNNEADGNGLIQECERITGLGSGGISQNGVRLKDFTARINNAKDRFFALAFEYDSAWTLDDRNYADANQELPIATTNLVSGQSDYLFSSELLGVIQVFVKDTSGNWVEIKPEDDTQEPNAYTARSTGTPTYYELIANSIMLSPTPDYSSSSGLKVVFKRNGTKFNYTDGSASIGIPSLFHPYLAREASLSYLIEKRIASKDDVSKLVARDEDTLKQFIANRAKPKKTGLRVNVEDNR